jgi:hypothetical protein
VSSYHFKLFTHANSLQGAANNGTAAAGGNTGANGQAGNGQANLPTAGKLSKIS